MKKIFSLVIAIVSAICMTTSVFAIQLPMDASAMPNVGIATSANVALFSLKDGLARFPQKRVAIVRGKKLKVGALAYNKKGKKVKLTYKSSNTKVATVNKSNGTIVAKKTGSAKITVTGKGVKKAVLTVVVIAKTVKVTDLRVTNWAYDQELFIGNSKAMNVVITPSNATNATVQYKSLNPSVATVSASGVVTGVATGTANIVVSCRGVSKEYVVLVGKPPTILNQVIYSKNGITITADNMMFSMGGGSTNEILWFTAVNNSNQKVYISYESIKVNGYNIGSVNDYGAIEANSAASKYLSISRSSNLKNYNIREITSIEFRLSLKDRTYTDTPIDFTDPIILNV